jgi:hypothetical protein
MTEYAATGLPPAYVPHDTTVDHDNAANDDDPSHPAPKEYP